MDADGDVVWLGPGDGFGSHTEATLFLILTPGLPLDWRVQPYDGPALTPFSPPKPRLES